MKKILFAGLSAALFAASVSGAVAQTKLERNQIINSLQGGQQRVEVSADELQRAAFENIQKFPGANSPGNLQLWEKLASLRQFNVEITFDLNSARIRPESYETVGVIADALHTPYLQGQTFYIVGHTDATGPRDYNLELSIKRAKSVRDALVTTFAVPGEYLEAVGLGEEQLRDPAQPASGINRRVQLINVGFR